MKRTEAQNLMHALQGAAPAIQKVGWTAAFDFICDFVSVFSFSGFKAKAFSFCLFFYPLRVIARSAATKQSKTFFDCFTSFAMTIGLVRV